MNTILRYLGPILVVLGALCIVIYHCASQSNVLLVIALVLELLGIIGHIVINKFLN